jgi:elongation factor Ts
MITIEQVKELRNITGVSISECKKALKEAKGDMDKAKEILKKQGQEFARDRLDRSTKEGMIDSYIHSGKKVGVMIELNCESDFVARSEDFQNLAHEICLQVAVASSEQVPILEQPWIKDPKRTMKDLIDEYIAKFGENISLKRFIRYEL